MTEVEFIFATGNKNKVEEVRKLLPKHIKIRSLRDIGYHKELAETQNTIEKNAKQKAEAIYHEFDEFVFAEDTGLEVEALSGEPGVKSARYAGEQKNDDDNMNLLLHRLQGKTNRSARFKTVIALFYKDKCHFFDGILNGSIIKEKRGDNGFGYDPIFVPDGYNSTLAELTSEEKNAISHRAKAMQKLIKFLASQ